MNACFLSAFVLHRILAYVMIFARYFSRRCLHAAFADYLGALLFACHYHTLCSLAEFSLFFLAYSHSLFSFTIFHTIFGRYACFYYSEGSGQS